MGSSGVVLVAVPGTFPPDLEALGLDLSYLSLAALMFIRALHTLTASCCRRKLFKTGGIAAVSQATCLGFQCRV